MDNPKAALDALLETTTRVGEIDVHPLTVARYALLELAGSPLVDFKNKLDVMTAIPSVYIMAMPTKSLPKYNSTNIDKLKEDAFEWAEDALVIGSVGKVLDMLAQKLLDLKRLMPENVEEPKKKLGGEQPTDGSPL